MKICVGSPGSLADTKRILKETGKDIAEIYLAVKLGEFGSGRDRIYDLGLLELKYILKNAAQYNVEISIAFNALCFNGKQYESDFKKKFDKLMKNLGEIKIKKIILSDPFLIEHVLKNYKFHITVSSISLIDSVEKARLYEEMGVHRLILPMDSARNIKLVKDIRKSVRCELEIMANLGCLYTCPNHSFHSQYHSHSSRNEVRNLISDDDPYKVFCTELMKKEPWRIINSSFIRPEDLEIFDEIGIDYVKLAGRELGVEWIIRAVKAYVKRSYTGNLLEILSTTDRISSNVQIDNKRISREFIKKVTGCSKRCYSLCNNNGSNYCQKCEVI